MELLNKNWKVGLLSLLISPVISKIIKSISNEHVEISFLLVAPLLFLFFLSFKKKQTH